MADIVSKEVRSWMMSGIKGKNTKPEMTVRSTLHKFGYRFRLHSGALPGKPDIVLPKYRIAIFVHGCFWHRHGGCRQGAYFPKNPRQGVDFWTNKFNQNIERDRKNVSALESAGWKVLVIWECEVRDEGRILGALKNIISGGRV